jgi:hypothetical protein
MTEGLKRKKRKTDIIKELVSITGSQFNKRLCEICRIRDGESERAALEDEFQ